MKSWVLNAIGAQVPDQTNTSSKCDDAFQSYYIIFTWLLQVWKPHPAAMPSKNRQMKLNDILHEIICRSICMIDPSKQYYWHVAVVPLVATAKMPPELSVRTRKGKTHLNSKRLTSCNGNQHFLTVVWLTRSQTTRQVTDRPWLPAGPKDQASKLPQARWGFEQLQFLPTMNASSSKHQCKSSLWNSFEFEKSWWKFQPWLNLNKQMPQRSLLSFPQLFPICSQHCNMT